MQSKRRDLEYFGKNLTDEQVVEKKRMLKESAEYFPEVAEYFRELVCDFVVRNPEEAMRGPHGGPDERAASGRDVGWHLVIATSTSAGRDNENEQTGLGNRSIRVAGCARHDA